MKYMILLYGSQKSYDAMSGKSEDGVPVWSPQDFAKLGAFMESYNNDLSESGELVDTRALSAPVLARRIQLQKGAQVVTDGPYPESQEVLAGYWVVDCESFDRATKVAAKLLECPGPYTDYDGYVDVRPMADSRSELL